MPDIFESLKGQTQETKNPQSTQDNVPTIMDEKRQQGLDNFKETEMNTKPTPQPSGFSSEQEKENFAVNEEMRQQAPISEQSQNQQIQYNEESMGADITQRGFLEESGTSFMKGLGNHVVGGFGDIAQVLGSAMGISDMYEGNVLSHQLQEWGGDIANKNKVAIPEELKDPEFSIKTLMNPRFWSTYGAEFAPQLAEFILLSKGAGSLARAGASKLAKQGVKKGLLKNTKTTLRNNAKKLAQNVDETYDVAGSGKGVGKLVNEAGELAGQTGAVIENVSAGISNNVLSGILNSAEAYNSRKEMVDNNGNPLFSKEELSDIAAATFKNNLQWMGVDILSWSMVYGGGNKILRNSNLYKKGSQAFNKSKSLKNISKDFSSQMSPLLKRVVNASGKALSEGFEETFQETFESWSAIRAEEEVTGKPSKYKNFMDFYNSDENEATKTIAFALGALGGGTFGLLKSVNNRAEELRKLYDRTENLKTVFDNGDQEGKEWQQFHIRETMSDIVLNGKEDSYEAFINNLVGKEIINEDELQNYNEMFEDYKVIKEQADKLNIRGKYALLKNHSEERFFQEHIQNKGQELQENIEIVNAIEGLTDSQKRSKVKQMEKEYDAEIEPLLAAQAQATANKANLMLGEKADINININFNTDENGVSRVAVGLNNDDFKYYVEDEDADILAPSKKEGGLKSFFKSFGKKDLKGKAKSIFSDIKDSFKNTETEESVSNEDESIKDDVEQKVDDSEQNNPDSEQEASKTEQNVQKPESVDQNITDDEIEDLSDTDINIQKLQKQKDVNDRKIKSLQTLEEDESATDGEKANAGIAVNKLKEKNSKIDEALKNLKNKSSSLIDKAKKSIKSFISREDVDPEIKEDTIAKSKVSSDKIHPNVLKSITEKILGKKKLSEKEQALADKFSEAIEEAKEFVGGKTKRFQSFVNDQKTKSEPKINKIKSTVEKATIRIKDSMSKLFSSAGPFGRESRNLPAVISPETENEIEDKFDQYKPIDTSNIKGIPSVLGKIKYGPNNVDKMYAINTRLQEIFPNTNKRITAYILDDLYKTIGIQGVGYAVGSSIFVRSDRWNQGKTFMHEMSHIYFKFMKEDPTTKQILNDGLKNKDLVNKIKSMYPDYILYEFETESGQKHIGTATNEKFKKATELPQEQQQYINEEIFVAMLEGPLSKKYNSFFAPKAEFKRQTKAVAFWNKIKSNAQEDENFESDTKELITKLNEGKPLNVNNMADYMVTKFNEFVDPIENSELGFEARRSEYKALDNDQKSEIIADLQEETENFSENAFDSKRDKTIDPIEELLDEEIIEEFSGEGDPSPILNIMEKSFQSRAAKATKILKQFVRDYNKAVRLRKLYGIEGNVPFDRKEFMYRMYELAKYSPDAPTFINEIENSPLNDVAAFDKFLEIKAPDQKKLLLRSMWFVMSNFRMVNALNTNLVPVGNQIEHRMEEALSIKEATQEQNILSNLANARNKARQGSSNLVTDQWNQFENIIEKIENNEETPEDYVKAYQFIAGPKIKTLEILEYGYMNVMGTNYTPNVVLKSFIKNKRHLNKTGNYKGQLNPYNFGPLARAIVVTNRSFTQDSIVKNAKGNMVPVRITNNHMTKEMDQIVADLRPDRFGNIMSKKDFLKKYSHITSSKSYRKPVNNLFLENIYDSVVQNDVIPDITYYTGINSLSDGTQNTFDTSTAFEQSFQDMMIFADSLSQGKKTFLSNAGTFGDSPRKFYLPSIRIKHNDVFNSSGSFNSKGKDVIGSLYNIYRNIQQDPLSRESFEKKVLSEIKREGNLIIKNADQLSKFKNLSSYYNGKTLNENGKKMVREYVMNTIASGLYMTEVFSPNIYTSDIAKRLKNSSSPVMSVNKNLKFEPIFFKDAGASTDGGMYITDKDAKRWASAGLGVFDLNEGFKFLNYSVEKENPNFKGQTVLLKGYTTVLSEAEVQKNPKLKGLYNLLNDRSKKYEDFYKSKYGSTPPLDFSNGLPNSFPIAIPMSSVKSNIYSKFNSESIPSLDELNDGTETANSLYDKSMYKNNQFLGLQGYNFGPQQIMDKQTKTVTHPVQKINALLVNASNLGHLEEAEAIQKIYSDEMSKELNKLVSKFQSAGQEAYQNFIDANIDKEAMDQVQRNVLKDYGIMHPRANQIVVNQLANSIKVAGNKLKIPGTYAHQKSDFGYQLPQDYSVKQSQELNGYTPNTDGSLTKAEIVLPKHLSIDNGGNVRGREYYTLWSKNGENTLTITDQSESGRSKSDLENLKHAAEVRAKSNNVNIGEVFKAGKLVGYYIEGDTVLATRVPSNGPAFTGVFEAVDFATGEGNQVQVPTSFTETIGADLDGDALFIEHKGKNPKLNEAIDRIAKLWLSKEMAPVIQTAMNTKQESDRLKSIIQKDFPHIQKTKALSMSPAARRKDYEDSMIAKRNIGTVFSLHRVANILAAYETPINIAVNINGNKYDTISDEGIGEDSRNHKSALVANLILDNLKEQSADALNINEHTVSAFSLLVNMNVPIEDVARIMNAPLVKEYVDILNENNSAFHGYIKRAEILQELKSRDIKDPSGKKVVYNPKMKEGYIINSNPNEKAYYGSQNQSAILDMILSFDSVNQEIQALSKIMAGHNGIETNPYLLSKQIDSFKNILNNESSNQKIRIQSGMSKNPDIVRYLKTAEETLERSKEISPVYRPAVTKMLNSLSAMINNDVLTDNQIKKYTGTVSKFLHSQLFAINMRPKEEVDALLEKKSESNIFNQVNDHLSKLKSKGNLEKSTLFTKALNMKLSGNKPYISLNADFFDESLTRAEFVKIKREFDNLPAEFQYDLITYDLLNNGWESRFSILPIAGDFINSDISAAMSNDFNEKQNKEYSDNTLNEIERILVSKDHNGARNNFARIDTRKKTIANALSRNPFTRGKLLNNEPFYFQALTKEGKGLFKFNGFTKPEFAKHFQKTNDQLEYLSELAKKHIQKVNTGTDKELDRDIITISDGNFRSLGLKKNFKPKKLGMEQREEYWEYSSQEEMSFDKFSSAMEFTKYDGPERQQLLYEEYQNDKKQANLVYESEIKGKDLFSYPAKKLVNMYENYASQNAYAYSVVTTPIIKALANKLSASQSHLTERYQTNDDVSPIKSFLMANNVPSNHPAVQGMVRVLEVEQKKFSKEKSNYVKRINEVTDPLYKEVFGFSVLSNKPGNLLKRLYYTYFVNRKNFYQALYGPLVEQNEFVKDGRTIKEFKFKSKDQIEELFKAGGLSKAQYDFYNTFTQITEELKPFSTEKGKVRRDYIPHTSMGVFESFSNRGLLGLLQSSKPENERVYDIKVYVNNPESGKKELWSFKEVEDHYKAISGSQGSKFENIKEYISLRNKAKKHLKKGVNEDGSQIEYHGESINSALSFGVMNRFANSRSITAEQWPSMDLNHALSSYVHSTLFVNGNKNFGGFKKMQGVVDGILAFNQDRGLKNINKYVKINWKDSFLKNSKQPLLGKYPDKAVDLITKLNLFYQLGFKASYVIGNVAAGKYHNIKNGSPKEWVLGEKRFWGVDKSLNPMEAMPRMKRAQKILKTIQFMDINIYDEVSFQSKSRIDNFFGDLALLPMSWSEKWIQGVQMLGMLSDEEWNKFDDNGNYKPREQAIPLSRITMLENEVKSSQGKGYQITDQRAIQQYSLGRLFMQFARFVPTMFHDRFAKQDVDIYGNEHVGSLRAIFDMVARVQSMNPKDYIAYRNSLDTDMVRRLDSGLKGLAMSSLIGAFALHTNNRMADNFYWDANYYMDIDKLAFKLKPSAVRATQSLVDSIL